MPRPRKCRKVCKLPENKEFIPVHNDKELLPVVLQIDEYETLRLIDREGFSQEQCGEYMNIARATVQQIYTSARKKIADALVDGRSIQISGGDYLLCEGKEHYCNCGGCQRHRCHPTYENEEKKMKIAIPLDENKTDVCLVLARAPFFFLWEDGKESVIENSAANAQSGAGLQVTQVLLDNSITTLLTPRCGQNAADVFVEAEIKIYKSTEKTAIDNIKAFQDGKLEELTHFHGGYHGA